MYIVLVYLYISCFYFFSSFMYNLLISLLVRVHVASGRLALVSK